MDRLLAVVPSSAAIKAPAATIARTPSHSSEISVENSKWIPLEILESLLRVYLASDKAVVHEYICTPFAHQGTNDSSTIFRVSLKWSLPTSGLGIRKATWIIKHWKVGGRRDGSLHILQPREALAWEKGWLHPSMLPYGLEIPIVAVFRATDNSEAWLAMEDQSVELSAYARLALSGDHAIRSSRAILARLAIFHAQWEQPQHQPALQASSWLRRPQVFLWDMASTYASALGRTPPSRIPAGASAPPLWEGLREDLEAFLEARPLAERRVWEELMINRRILVEGLAAYPQTLLHNDLDDRNIGLRWCGDASQSTTGRGDQADVVLIDWEWIALGPAVLDVADIILRLPILIQPGTPFPESVWSDELTDEYFERYPAAGGRCVDAAHWRHAFGLATVARAMAQMPFVHGSMRRTIRGEVPPPKIVGVPESIVRQHLRANLPVLERMEERVMRDAYRLS